MKNLILVSILSVGISAPVSGFALGPIKPDIVKPGQLPPAPRPPKKPKN